MLQMMQVLLEMLAGDAGDAGRVCEFILTDLQSKFFWKGIAREVDKDTSEVQQSCFYLGPSTTMVRRHRATWCVVAAFVLIHLHQRPLFEK